MCTVCFAGFGKHANLKKEEYKKIRARKCSVEYEVLLNVDGNDAPKVRAEGATSER